MPTITNIAAYKFAPLDDLKALRASLRERCVRWGLKGTILLSREGINLFVAGPRDEIDLLLADLAMIPNLGPLDVKISQSDEQPFRRMLVKIKPEIIAFGQGIDPSAHPTRRVSPRDLKRWLDEGRDVVLLDTRNDYEVKLGTFQNAVTMDLDHFRNFPEVSRTLPDDLKTRRVVTFCTGGIRCEKAGPFLEREGFADVYQLDGGILRYFEECGGSHFVGECFVFDGRVGLDASLNETDSVQCFACQAPLTPEEKADPRFVKGQSCPYCFATEAQIMARSIAMRHERIRQDASPLPGSVPYESRRPIDVPASYDGVPLLEFLRNVVRHVDPAEWQAVCEQERFLGPSMEPVGARHIVRAGERYYLRQTATIEPHVNPEIRILHEDEAILVIHKPAPIPMHPSGRFNRNTVQYFLNRAYHPQTPRPGHRLDAATAGVAVFARTRTFARMIQPQFERREVEKRYLARVHGHPSGDRFASEASIQDLAGPLGAREIDDLHGLPARTTFEVIRRFDDGTTLLAATPETGRSHQIRLHLWDLGWPIVGDALYLPDRQIATEHPAELAAHCLFAQSLEFTHPITRKRVTFQAEPPEWAVTGQY